MIHFCLEVAGYLPSLSLTFGRLVGHRQDGRDVDSRSTVRGSLCGLEWLHCRQTTLNQVHAKESLAKLWAMPKVSDGLPHWSFQSRSPDTGAKAASLSCRRS